MIPSSFNQIFIDSEALIHNYNVLEGIIGERDFLAMVKADGYGHGMVQCSALLEKSGCSNFGVAELREAIILRESGISSTIYSMIGFDHQDSDLFFEYDITPVVYDITSIQALADSAEKYKRDILVHLKVDTGMTRLGVYHHGLKKILSFIAGQKRIRLGGLASHFPCADDKASESTHECLKKFNDYAQNVGRESLYKHIANSGGTLYFSSSHHDMVRCGISLYGYYPDGLPQSATGDLQPVMSFTTRVLQVKDVAAGTGVSYGHTYITSRKTRLAVIPIGYEDGFFRSLSNCGEVLVRGKRAIVRGRVCMNLCMVDVTDIEGVQTGDEVVVLGTQGKESITADEIASKIGSISYEILCMFGNNNERHMK